MTATRDRLLSCAKLAAVQLGFSVRQDPLRPEQFEAYRRGWVGTDLLLVGVGVRDDTARVGATPLAGDERYPVSADARVAAGKLMEMCPPQPLRADSTAVGAA